MVGGVALAGGAAADRGAAGRRPASDGPADRVRGLTGSAGTGRTSRLTPRRAGCSSSMTRHSSTPRAPRSIPFRGPSQGSGQGSVAVADATHSSPRKVLRQSDPAGRARSLPDELLEGGHVTDETDRRRAASPGCGRWRTRAPAHPVDADGPADERRRGGPRAGPDARQRVVPPAGAPRRRRARRGERGEDPRRCGQALPLLVAARPDAAARPPDVEDRIACAGDGHRDRPSMALASKGPAHRLLRHRDVGDARDVAPAHRPDAAGVIALPRPARPRATEGIHPRASALPSRQAFVDAP